MDISDKKTSKTEALKDFWDRKKGAIAVTATATTVAMVALCRAQNKQFQQFVKEQGVETEFWKFIGATEEEIQDFIKTPN
ncbi:hypothetical protein SEA_SLOOPYJOE_34 [Arthrobacter phage Sloopyjoe]|nr:hypothetical protein PBI_STAYER_34 [Arthrobacter phage Stayer]QFG09743.1 hypothetical protein PBI_SHIBA_34 [Arthrobacter phage Shiba]QFG10178.1 hypothetical protein PBI_EGAD_34 [Arthrobacter phage Egad]QFG11748.1 hypothetical protein PBI_SALK_34 [Arthrobacter phage Salk]QFG12631.1 hypothetical protein PBI_MICHELLE_34 [Arthrobacter phage Michelle]QFG14404.1 hypothetical protein PBI_STARLORD_34 [Arthrobacter phage StarLord]UVT31112.1 hypothetical protein PBI_LINDA_34 [Arthrobacter phage Lind